MTRFLLCYGMIFGNRADGFVFSRSIELWTLGDTGLFYYRISHPTIVKMLNAAV